MKKAFIYVMALLPLLSMTSCGDDDNEPKLDGTEQNGGNNDEITGEIADIQEPILEFGKDYSYIKSKETRTLTGDVKNSMLSYTDGKHIKKILYSFVDDKLYTTDMWLVDMDYNEVVNYYKSKYKTEEVNYELQVAAFTKGKMVIYVQADKARHHILVSYSINPYL